MNTNFPSSTIYFVFAFTYCSVDVYTSELEFTKKVLECAGVELIEADQDQDFEKVDPRLILSLVAKAMPAILDLVVVPDKKTIIQNARATLCLPQSYR